MVNHATLVKAQQSLMNSTFVPCKILSGSDDTYEFTAKISKFERTGEHNDCEVYTLTAESTGPVVFTSGGETFVATPVISPAGGSTTTEDPVSITDATAGADIYFTLDGSTPVNSDTSPPANFYAFVGNSPASSIRGAADMDQQPYGAGYVKASITGGKIRIGGDGANSMLAGVFVTPQGGDCTYGAFITKFSSAPNMSDRMPRLAGLFCQEAGIGYRLGLGTVEVGVVDTGLAPFAADVTYHCVVRWASNVVSIWVDGVKIYENGSYTNPANEYINAYNTQNGASGDGSVDKLFAYGVALSDAAIVALASGVEPDEYGIILSDHVFTGSKLYVDPFFLPIGSYTVKAIGFKTGLTDSAEASESFIVS